MKLILNLLLSVITFSGIAQIPDVKSQKAIGGYDHDVGIGMVILENGDYVICSKSKSISSHDKSEDGFGDWDYWIIKVSKSGLIVWETTVGGSGSDQPSAIIETSDGGLLISGTSDSPISGNKTAASFGFYDIWVVKLNSNGDIEWDKSFGGNTLDYSDALLKLSNGHYLLGNTSRSGISGNKTTSPRGDLDFWVIEIDSIGGLIKQFSFGGNGPDELNDIKSYGQNKLVLTGRSSSNISGEKNEDGYGGPDFWIIISDMDGNVINSSTQGGAGVDEPRNLVIKPDSGIMVFGYSSSEPSGTKTSLNYGNRDYWVVSFDDSLNKVGDASFGGSAWDATWGESMGVYHQPINEYVISGISFSNVSGNKITPAIYPSMQNDVWVIGLDENQNKTFELVLGGVLNEDASGVFTGHNNELYILGSSNSDISGNKTEPRKGLFDIWIIELDFNLSVKTIVNPNELKTYPNPVSTILTYSLPMATTQSEVTLTDISGKILFTESVGMVKESQINVSNMPKGMYVLSIISNEYQYTRKVLIE